MDSEKPAMDEPEKLDLARTTSPRPRSKGIASFKTV